MSITYGRMYRAGKRWVLEGLPPHVAIKLKSMFARIPKTQTGTFDLPATEDMGADLIWFLSRYPMEMTDLDRGMLMLAGWHREVYDIWLKELAAYRPVLYTGSETSKQKDKAADDFINGRTNLFIISLRSGEGLDGLQFVCYHVVVGELDWSPQVYEQLFGRLDRPGQPEPEITAHFLYSESGSDPVIMSTNAVKRDQARGISDPGIILPAAYTDESHIKKLAQSYLERENA